MMGADLWQLYEQMLRSRLFEEGVHTLWDEGLISGEMHLSAGEEGIAAGVTCHLEASDAMAVDHRTTAPFLMRGVDPVLMLREFLGREDGLCRGWGGHMHLFSREHLAASSGIVGASGPAAAGFALAAQHLRPGSVAVAFFGEGATNQGMLLESMNLAAAWTLPLVLVCKDNQWAITTPSPSVTGGRLAERARGFGLRVFQPDGADVEAVAAMAGEAIDFARRGQGPSFMLASCVHLEGHFLGDLLFRISRRPLQEMLPIAGPLTTSLLKTRGASFSARVRSLVAVAGRARQATKTAFEAERDPLLRARQRLAADETRLEALEKQVEDEISLALERAVA